MEENLFSAMYHHKAPIMIKYLVKIGCQREDAEDIVQETFIKAMTYMVHLEEKNLSAWLFKVALNKYYDLCRKHKRRPEMTIDDEHFLNTFIEEDKTFIHMLRQEKASVIQEVLEQMNPLYKNLLLMKYDMDLSYEQIGEIVDMKQEKVKTYLYRARQAFKKSWEDK